MVLNIHKLCVTGKAPSIEWRDIVTDNRHRLSLSLFKFRSLIDLLIAVLSFGITTVMIVHAQSNVSLATFLSMRTKISNVLILFSILYFYSLVFRIFGLYRSRYEIV